MKRLITCLFGFALLCSVGFAKEFNNGISNGGFFVLENHFGQGCGEWSFPILQTKKNFMIRDNVTIGGFGGTEMYSNTNMGGMTIGNKLIMGGVFEENECFVIRSYGIIGIDASLFGTENHSIFSPDVMLGTIFGGGFEFQYSKQNSFVIEFGGKNRYVIGKNMASYKQFNGVNPIVTLGFRSYLENRNKSR